MKDSAKHLEKTSVSQHIGDRGRVTERTTRTNTREVHQHEDLHGIADDSQLERFKSDWKNATRNAAAPAAVDAQKRKHRAIKDSKHEASKL